MSAADAPGGTRPAGRAPARRPGRDGGAALAAASLGVAQLATLAMVALVAVEIVARAAFRTSTLVADEFAGYLLVALGFAGLADGFRADAFIRVELLHQRLPVRWRPAWDAALRAAALLYTAFLAYHAWVFVATSYRLGTRSVHFARTPLWIPRAVMAAGLTALALELARGLRARRDRAPETR